MKQPTEEDFKAHGLAMCIKHGQPGGVALAADCIELGYKMAVKSCCGDIEKATKDLREFRETNNAPR